MPLPGTRPGTKPGVKPGERPSQLPNRPGAGNRPGNRPSIKPVPNPGNRPGFGNRPGKPGQLPSRPGWNNKPVQRPPFDRPGYRPNRPGKRPWWDSGRRPGHGNKVNIRINNNFRHSMNWSTNRHHWGYNPWWNCPARRPWYGGSWHCGWKPHYHYHYHYHSWPGYSAGAVIGWGLAAWGLGTLIYNAGYNSYKNPYPAQPVPTTTGTPVTYQEPITVVSAETAPQEEKQIEQITEKSESAIEKSQAAFKEQNYTAALDAANKAVAKAPGEAALHEYRALVLFALGKYDEAAGVLNPVLASGPGWDWTTMVKLYDSQKTYTDQLQKLEEYSVAKPDDAAAHFLLGYHYMVCGHLKEAEEQFQTASKLQPADTVSRQLASLLSVSATSEADGETAEAPKEEAPADQAPAEAAPAPEPVPLEKLTGTWVADKGADGKITLVMNDDGKFTWTFKKGDEKPFELAGEFSMNENGLLVLDAEESQMVATVDLPKDDELHFVLAAGPPGDPGLTFKKD